MTYPLTAADRETLDAVAWAVASVFGEAFATLTRAEYDEGIRNGTIDPETGEFVKEETD
jgi:hypothetical protein